MNRKRKKTEKTGKETGLNVSEVYDSSELVLEENLRLITNLPHENRGSFVKELIQNSKSVLKDCPRSFFRPVDIEAELLADYPILRCKQVADQFHAAIPNLNWGGSKYY